MILVDLIKCYNFVSVFHSYCQTLFFFQTNFHDKTPYTIMFGPDKCGNDHKVTTIIDFILTVLIGAVIHDRHSPNAELCYICRSF